MTKEEFEAEIGMTVEECKEALDDIINLGIRQIELDHILDHIMGESD